ncbi:MAG: BofC C-terminal domain-containing protein [Coriobacteriaceae bacterium]|jgi:tRNA A-37 threonylcarbamoyl transferase component Bud32|nr:BofC C-terminal domain-containing protein [Coriobacteriaceae bacterium]
MIKRNDASSTKNTLGPYELRGELGRGAMAKVWRAWDPKLEREVAIKEPLFDDRLSPDILEEMGSRFIKEGKAAARLNHPGIVTIHAAEVYDSRPVIVMELVDGITLGEMLETRPLKPPAALDALDQLLDAVGYAHSQGVVHRDIKPDNIFVTKDGRIKLSDFGIAHIEDSSMTRKTQLGTVLGTPGYMAPEQATGSTIDNRTDLFAIGTIAYEMLTGENPFGAGDGTDTTTLIYRIVYEPVPDMPAIVSEGLPTDLRPAILASMNKSPDERPQDAASFKAMLHGAEAPAVGTKPAPSRTPKGTLNKGRSVQKYPKWLPYALVGALGVVIVGIIFAFATSGGGGGIVVAPLPEGGSEEPAISAEEEGFFLTIAGGMVALSRGTPESPSAIEQISDIEVSSLKPETANLLEKGIVVLDVETAEALMSAYRKQAEVLAKSTPAPAPAPVLLSPSEIEDEVLRIRALWQSDRSAIGESWYDASSVSAGITAYSDGSVLKMIEATAASNSSGYARTYQYENGNLIFAYLEKPGGDSHRLYFKNGTQFRWIYTPNISNPDGAIYHDNDIGSSEYISWQNFALNEANDLYKQARS